MHQLQSINLTKPEYRSTDVEHKTSYVVDRCALNIFETHKKAKNIQLQFEGFTITSMLRGKKIIHQGDHSYDYIPGQTLMLTSNDTMVIDFPEANQLTPTQCTALVIDDAYLKSQIDFLNERLPRNQENQEDWVMKPDLFFLQNDEQIVSLENRLLHIFRGTDPLKDVLIDLKLKELILAIMRSQNLHSIHIPSSGHSISSERLKAVVEFIRRNASEEISVDQLSDMAYMSKSTFYRWFAQEFGMSPHRMILMEKIKLAKEMIMGGSMAMKEIGYAAGFSDPNYFSRIFKKFVGKTPMEFKLQSLS